nr:transposase, MuDR, MULE transposase domain protein [Tanacetum cinerariifolium]
DFILIVNLDPTPADKIQAGFDSSIPYFNGIVDKDGKCYDDDYVLVSKDNYVDEDCNMCEDASTGFSKDEIVNDKLVDEDYLNSNQTGVDQELGGAANDPMPDQMNDHNCSQPILASMDALIQACAYAADHPELDVLQHEAHVDRSGPKINQHPMAEPLTVFGMDGNSQIIPIVTSMSQGETGESWTWFLSKLKDCIGEVPNLAIISDRHYAIILACKTIFPNSFHGFYCRHLMMNCGMQSERYKVLYWKTCKAYIEQKFNKLMSGTQAIRPDAHHKLVKAGIEKWSRAKCHANRYNYMTSNSVESVNALTKEVRKIPITALMDWYRDRLRKWYYERREKHEDSHDEELTPWACAKIRYRMLKSSNWSVNGVLRDEIRSQGEGTILTRYGRCGAMGHNRTACNVPLPSVQNTSIRIDGMHESSNPRDSFMNASHEEANHKVYQQGMYEPQHISNNMEDMYHP